MASRIHRICPLTVLETQVPDFVIKEVLEGLKKHQVEEDLTETAWGDFLFTTTGRFKCIINSLNFLNLKTLLQENVSRYISFYKNLKKRTYYLRESWVNYNYKYSFQNTHTHGLAGISGVLYLQTTGTGEDGDIYFPCSVEHRDIYESYLIRPQVGKLLVFHSSLSHQVAYNRINTTRISLSFNFREAGSEF